MLPRSVSSRRAGRRETNGCSTSQALDDRVAGDLPASGDNKESTTATIPGPTDEMPGEIDFSSGERGKFFHAGAAPMLPVYIDAEMHGHLVAYARARGMTVSQLVNELLGKDVENIKAANTRAQPWATRALAPAQIRIAALDAGRQPCAQPDASRSCFLAGNG